MLWHSKTINLFYLLELGNSLWSSENSLWSICSHLCSFTVGSSSKQFIEFCDKQLIRPSQIVPDSHPQGEVAVVEGVLDVGDDGLLVHGHGQDLAPPVDPNDAIAGIMLGGHKDGVRTDTVLIDQGPCLDVVQVNVAVLGDQVDDVVLDGHLEKEESSVKSWDGGAHAP